MRIISIYPNFFNEGGAQNVTLQVAKAFSSQPIVLTETKLNDVCPKYKNQACFLPFTLKNIIRLIDDETIFISHHRKTTTKLVALNVVLFHRMHIIHVAHTTFNNLKFLTFYPKHIIAVSNAVKKNLLEYFHVSKESISVIFNGIKDVSKEIKIRNDKTIKILLPGRICAVKQQVKIVKETYGRLNSNVQIYFAGLGEDEEELKKLINESNQYKYLGYQNIYDCITDYDYIMLFSEKEGLGLSLIEGCMFSKPLITNTVPAVLDVNIDKVTGYVYSNFEELINGLNSLPEPNSSEYLRLAHNSRLHYQEFFKEEDMLEKYYKEFIKELEVH